MLAVGYRGITSSAGHLDVTSYRNKIHIFVCVCFQLVRVRCASHAKQSPLTSSSSHIHVEFTIKRLNFVLQNQMREQKIYLFNYLHRGSVEVNGKFSCFFRQKTFRYVYTLGTNPTNLIHIPRCPFSFTVSLFKVSKRANEREKNRKINGRNCSLFFISEYLLFKKCESIWTSADALLHTTQVKHRNTSSCPSAIAGVFQLSRHWIDQNYLWFTLNHKRELGENILFVFLSFGQVKITITLKIMLRTLNGMKRLMCRTELKFSTEIYREKENTEWPQKRFAKNHFRINIIENVCVFISFLVCCERRDARFISSRIAYCQQKRENHTQTAHQLTLTY